MNIKTYEVNHFGHSELGPDFRAARIIDWDGLFTIWYIEDDLPQRSQRFFTVQLGDGRPALVPDGYLYLITKEGKALFVST